MATVLTWQLSLVAMITMMGLHKVMVAEECAFRELEYGTVCMCNATFCDRTPKPEVLPAAEYLLYTSLNTGSRLKRSTGSFASSVDSDWTGDVINVNQTVTFQKIYGFGGAFTDAAGLNIKSLSEDAQLNFLKSYFADDGIKYNFGRVPIGGTDFSTHAYSYADKKGTPDLSNFGLSYEDTDYKIPLIKIATEIASDELKLMGSAWSSPTWMKTNHDFSGIGFLKPAYLDSWAEYHLKFLDEYRKHNLTFWAITAGNEPLNGILPRNRINTLGWNPLSHREWIGHYLGPKLKASEHNATLLFSYDDQRLLLPWWITIDEECEKYTDGFGVHWYYDSEIPVEALDDIYNAHKDKNLLHTESSQGLDSSEVTVRLGSWERAEMKNDTVSVSIRNPERGVMALNLQEKSINTLIYW